MNSKMGVTPPFTFRWLTWFYRAVPPFDAADGAAFRAKPSKWLNRSQVLLQLRAAYE